MKYAALAVVVPLALSTSAETRLKGYLGERLDAMIEKHVIGTDTEYITAPFMEKTERNGWWHTEFWGKYMHSAMPYLEYSKSEKLRANVERGLERMLASQEPCGYIGNYPDELRCGEGWDVWGMKYTMLGLLHYYDLAGQEVEKKGGGGQRKEQVLSAAKRLCDYVIEQIGPNGKRGRELWQTGNWSGYASSSILEPVVWLYRETREQKYLDFASYIVRGMTAVNPEGPRLLDLALKGVSVADRNEGGKVLKPEEGTAWAYVCKHGRGKAYEMMSCYQGLLDFVEEKVKVEGEGEELRNLRKAAIMTGEDIIREEINLAGGCASSEAWYHGAKKQHLPYLHLQETCVTTTWMRFCQRLLAETDDPKWADQIERTFYNAYLGAMKADGAEFAGYTPLTGNRYHGQHHCFMHTDCCTANGPRGFLCFLRELFTVRKGLPTFNFYTTALVREKLADGKTVAFDMYSLYPRKDFVRLVSHTENVGELPIRFRIPGWTKRATVKVNGQAVDGVKSGAYCTVTRAWKLGDVIELAFEMPVVAHRLEHNIAFTRGPILLARDSRFADGEMSEVFRGGIKDGDTLPFASVRTPSDDFWMAFSAVLPLGTHHENPEGANPAAVMFCDYASAGNTWRRDNYYRTWFPVEIAPETR